MEKLIDKVGAKQLRNLGTILTTLLVLVVVTSTVVSATNVTSTVTGYAWGNAYGASGNYLNQADFANHSSLQCPNDPAASWPFGTNITMVDPPYVTVYLQNGHPSDYATLTLEDTGDPTCAMPNYWVDIYFGHYALPTEVDTCDCPGSPAPGYCISASSDNCQNAKNHGAPSETYSY